MKTNCHAQAPTNQGYNQLNNVGTAFKTNGYNLPPAPPVCTTQQLQLFDSNRVYSGVFPVQVCNQAGS